MRRDGGTYTSTSRTLAGTTGSLLDVFSSSFTPERRPVSSSSLKFTWERWHFGTHATLRITQYLRCIHNCLVTMPDPREQIHIGRSPRFIVNSVIGRHKYARKIVHSPSRLYALVMRRGRILSRRQMYRYLPTTGLNNVLAMNASDCFNRASPSRDLRTRNPVVGGTASCGLALPRYNDEAVATRSLPLSGSRSALHK